MTDEPSDSDTPTPIERLTSELIDGELDAAARAEALDDPATKAVIDAALRDTEAVRAALADVEPAAISMRERHLAAALEAWDRLPEAERTGERRDTTPADVDGAAAAGAAAVTAPPTPLRRRSRRNSAWLTAAAAGLVLVLAGGLVLRAATGGDDDGGDMASFDLDGGSDTTAAAVEEAGAAESGAVTVAPSAEARAADASADGEAAPEAEAGDRVSNEVSEALNEDSTVAVQPGDFGPPPDTDLETLSTRDDVAAFAATAVDAPRAPDVEGGTGGENTSSDDGGGDDHADDEANDLMEAAAEPRCGRVDLVVGRAIYDNQVALIGIDLSADLAFAHVPETCRELVRVPLPD